MTVTGAMSAALYEDVLSLGESWHFQVRCSDAGPPIVCECCGALVCLMLERDIRDGGEPRWRRAVWDHFPTRKHTLRRCEAIRVLGRQDGLGREA